ncbi:MAG TPA: hypothetical protein VK550_03095 [Polyangiaceae bacterium]|nr:hypothetical protein [Polyangiaceae bacterium]
MSDLNISLLPAKGTTGKAQQQYLAHYAEPEATIADRLTGTFGHALVIPAYDESDDLIRALQSVPAGPEGDVLIVLVVNAPPEAPEWVHERNRDVLKRLRWKFGAEVAAYLDASAPAHVFRFRAGRILHIDRAGPRHLLPSGQGVGLARKIGFDVALRLHQSRRLSSRWVHSTDADVILPRDYFERASAPAPPSAAALVYPFTHRGEEDVALARAVQLYEISLRYYVLGLASAGSPYAHHTIGSTLAVDAIAYAKVRGAPKRTAAEDFYLLGKLAKIGAIVRLGGAAISVSGRVSRRVPFGTGPAVERIARKGNFTLYHPRIFAKLGVWLAAMSDLTHLSPPGALSARLVERCRKAHLDPTLLVEMAAHPSLEAALAAARKHSKNAAKFRQHVAVWFDAFRTLKFVHALEARGLAPVPWFDALRDAPFAGRCVEDYGDGKAIDGLALAHISDRMAAIERQIGG